MEDDKHRRNDRLLTAKEAAKILGLSVGMIYRLIATDRLQRVKIGKATRFRLSDIEELMQRGAA